MRNTTPTCPPGAKKNLDDAAELSELGASDSN